MTELRKDMSCRMCDEDVVKILEVLNEAKDEIEELQEDSKKLNALEDWGVDNWSGYGEALSSMSDEENDDCYEIIKCSECRKDREVEKGTWALDNGMCVPCYRAYQGG